MKHNCPSLIVLAVAAAACGAGTQATPSCEPGQTMVDGACTSDEAETASEGSLRVAYFYSFSNKRGVHTVNFGDTHEIANVSGAHEACGKKKSVAACEVGPTGRLRAVTDDCAVGRVDGAWVESECSLAEAKNASDGAIQRVSCCVVDAQALAYPEDPRCGCRPWAEVAEHKVEGKCKDGAECAEKLGLTDQCADPSDHGQPWCFTASECPDASYDHALKQWFRRCR
jgi:hypothetical protein